MKTLKVLKQFLKQKAGEFWTILKFETDYTIPNVVRNWVVVLAYGPILILLLYYVGLLTSYISGMPIKSFVDHVILSIAGILILFVFLVVSLVFFIIFIKELLDVKTWIVSNWNDAKRKIEENEKAKS
jgi:hypothetical protein